LVSTTTALVRTALPWLIKNAGHWDGTGGNGHRVYDRGYLGGYSLKEVQPNEQIEL
jgi:hypothetical protein